MASDIIVRSTATHPFVGFNIIDPVPQYVEFKESKLSDLEIFARMGRNPNSIVVPEETVQELLGRIMLLQAPGQKVIRENNRKSARDGIATVHAQILSFKET